MKRFLFVVLSLLVFGNVSAQTVMPPAVLVAPSAVVPIGAAAARAAALGSISVGVVAPVAAAVGAVAAGVSESKEKDNTGTGTTGSKN